MNELLDLEGDERIRALVAGQTVPRLFRGTARTRGGQPALRRKTDEGWEELSWDDYADQAARTAALISTCGVEKGQTVALMMRNRVEFHPIDMGAYLAGCSSFSIYNSSSPEQIEFLLRHSEARVVFVEGVFAPAVRKVVGQLDDVRIVVVDGPAEDDETVWEDAIAAVEPVDLDSAADAVDPDDLATLIYTSGTTGPPKAVMLTHRNICWLLQALVEVMEVPFAGGRMLSYLPMAHVAERIFTHYLPTREGATVTPCPDATEIGGYLADVRPVAFFGPPRVFEKMRAGLIAALSSTEDGSAALERGLDIGRRMFETRVSGTAPSESLAAEWAAIDDALFGPVRAQLGLDACAAALTGAAPPPVEVIEFFNYIGIPFSEVYGLSEDTGLMTAQPHAPRPGSVGRPIPGCSVRLLEDGEILCLGGHVFSGYYKDPEKTAEVLDDDGWLHTGDVGVMEDDGYIRIIDRKKELIITAGGKNISPANIEAVMKQQPLIGEACAIGDKRPYVTAVLALDADATRAWADQHDLAGLAVEEAVAHPDLRAAVDAQVAAANERLSNVERVKKYHLTADEWLPDSDLLTPTMKLKRRGVLARYAEDIDALY